MRAARRAGPPLRASTCTPTTGDALPRPHGEHVRLRDGAEIVIRQVEPEDAAQLKLGFEHLGAVSRYRRFLAPLDHLSPEQVAYLTHVDHTNHEAIAALDAVTGEGIGVARFIRDPNDARLAEVAIVVTDAWQGRGVGTALVERLAARMRTVGVERIAARMLVGSEAPRRLIAHCADTLSEQRSSGTVVLEAKLHRPATHPCDVRGGCGRTWKCPPERAERRLMGAPMRRIERS